MNSGARDRWYNSSFTLLEMVKVLKGRECSFLESKVERETERKSIPVRCVKAHNIDYLKKNFEAFAFFKKNYDVYYSVASFDGFPMFSYAPKQREEQQKLFFGVQFTSYWVGYDFVLDIDGETVKDAYADAVKVKAVFDEFHLPYSLKFSGSRGFHFIVEYKDFFPSELPLDKCVELAYRIVCNLKEIEDIPGVDEKIYQKERLFKLPYSLTGNNVVLPLSDEQFNHFSIDLVKLENVIRNIKIKERGLLFRSNKETLNVSKFIDIYGGI